VARSIDHATKMSLLVAPNLLVHDAVLAYPALVLLASRAAPWDAASALIWLGHVVIAPFGVLWSAVIALAVGSRRGG